MLRFLEVLTVFLAALAMTFAVAHLAELPGKMRLDRRTYLTMQSIYYPGYTFGGVSEPLSILAVFLLMLLTPFGSAAFWWKAGAVLSMLMMQVIYWTVTHPVNNIWLKDQKLTGVGAEFFSIDANRKVDDSVADDWRKLRDRWEYSHVVRAGFAMLGLILLMIGITAPP